MNKRHLSEVEIGALAELEESDDGHTPDDLRVYLKEIKEFWHMGDRQIIPDLAAIKRG